MTDPTPNDDTAARPLSKDVVAVLVANHDRFLHFLQGRVGSRVEAEEILQDAFVRGIDKADSIEKADSVKAWFYRLLRNAIVEHHRRRAAEKRAMDTIAHDPLTRHTVDIDSELMDEVCRCVLDLAQTLKPDYAQIIQDVDVQEATLEDYAKASGITRNNATVRLHRARRALRAALEKSCGTCSAHGCLDCSCSRTG